MDVEAGAGSSYQHGTTPDQSLPGNHKIKDLQNDVDEITNVMKTNINKVLERGDRVDILNERSDLLSSRANEFRINSRAIRRKFWWQNFRIQLFIGTAVSIVLILIIYYASKSS